MASQIEKRAEDLPSFKHHTSSLEFLKAELRSTLFRKTTLKSRNLFLRGRDIISVGPQVIGEHEPELTALIDSFSKEGYGDFFIDIGANIGLTSCQNGSQFKEVHMYEPNPLCCHILEVNARIALDPSAYAIHPFGLGDSDKTALLTIPKKNWGGAFVRDSGNSYNDTLLARKDGFGLLDKKNYFDVEITIKDTSAELANLFQSLLKKGLKDGVIKIDVEGYEPAVLKGIASAFPKEMRAYIVFESWDQNFQIQEILEAFHGRAVVGKLSRYAPYNKNWSTLAKLVSLAFKWSIETKLEKITNSNYRGDIVLKVN
jgi:FkbM family methyltransferase